MLFGKKKEASDKSNSNKKVVDTKCNKQSTNGIRDILEIIFPPVEGKEEQLKRAIRIIEGVRGKNPNDAMSTIYDDTWLAAIGMETGRDIYVILVAGKFDLIRCSFTIPSIEECLKVYDTATDDWNKHWKEGTPLNVNTTSGMTPFQVVREFLR